MMQGRGRKRSAAQLGIDVLRRVVAKTTDVLRSTWASSEDLRGEAVVPVTPLRQRIPSVHDLSDLLTPSPLPCCDEREPKVVLVVGECGDGKSTLINALRDPKLSGEASAGLNSRGITKSIQAYIGKPIAGGPVEYLDTPGIGDSDVTPMKVLTLIEQELVNEGMLDAVIVTTPVPDGRVKLGAQVVQMLVQHGFFAQNKWQHVILVGTKADRATEEEIELFKSSSLDEEGRPVGIAGEFFSEAPGGTGTYVFTGKGDYSQLVEAIANLPDTKLTYSAPNAAKMAEVFSAKLGVDKGIFQQELERSREELNQQLAEERQKAEELEFKMATLKHEQELALSRQHEANCLVTKRGQAKQAELEEALQKALKDLRLASPANKRRLEEEKLEVQTRLRRCEEEFEEQREALSSQMREMERELKRLKARQHEQESQALKRPRNYNFGDANNVCQSTCKHPRTRRWANGHGQGRKCLDCKAELEYKK